MDNRNYKRYSVACQEDITCPAAEETVPIELVMEAQHKYKYENYSTGFFIRDISELCGEHVPGKQRCCLPHRV